MASLLEELYEIAQFVISTLGYPGIFLMMLVENLFPPFPSEMVMPFSGFMVADGQLNFMGILFAGTLGSVAGALIIYYLGHMLGRERLRKGVQKYGRFLLLSEEDLDKALDTFHRHGQMAILLGRLIPGVRSLISIPAGLEAMPIKNFLLLTTIGSVVWNMLLAAAGYFLRQNWTQILDVLDTYETVLLVIAAVVSLYYVIRRLNQRRQPA